jgi:hypothetical protein
MQCFAGIGRPLHEIMHALGIYHEQSRPDRDQYISVVQNNVVKGIKNTKLLDFSSCHLLRFTQNTIPFTVCLCSTGPVLQSIKYARATEMIAESPINRSSYNSNPFISLVWQVSSIILTSLPIRMSPYHSSTITIVSCITGSTFSGTTRLSQALQQQNDLNSSNLIIITVTVIIIINQWSALIILLSSSLYIL